MPGSIPSGEKQEQKQEEIINNYWARLSKIL